MRKKGKMPLANSVALLAANSTRAAFIFGFLDMTTQDNEDETDAENRWREA